MTAAENGHFSIVETFLLGGHNGVGSPCKRRFLPNEMGEWNVSR